MSKLLQITQSTFPSVEKPLKKQKSIADLEEEKEPRLGNHKSHK